MPDTGMTDKQQRRKDKLERQISDDLSNIRISVKRILDFQERHQGDAPSKASGIKAFARIFRWTRSRLGGPGGDIQDIKRSLKHILKNQRSAQLSMPAQQFRKMQAASKIQEISLMQLCPGINDVSVPLGCVNEATSHDNQVDMPFVLGMSRFFGARNIFEFGTCTGRTTYYFSAMNPEAKVVTLDLPVQDARAGQGTGSYFCGKPEALKIHQILEDSKSWDPASYRARMDYIFIDGDHSYEGVRNDTLKAFEMLAPGGTIVWHDFAAKSPGLVRFLTEWSRDHSLYQIRKTCLVVYRAAAN